MQDKTFPEKTVERLILYRRLLMNLDPEEKSNIFSHELSVMTGFTSAQIRRDLMAIGYSGSPVKGYEIKKLYASLSEFIDAPDVQQVAIIGLGQLGRAIVNYFRGRREKLEITAAFDKDSKKIDRVVNGVRCYSIQDLEKILQENNIQIAILAIPEDQAQYMGGRLASAGVKGILNYAPIQLKLPASVHVENRDMIMAVEKVAHFARQVKENGFHESIS
ncbi:MAG: redox-sensing transcriptional repressor Rex [Calditrichaeota bacterium]|nr:redox-sensing transcriptional repressor Rex [Calditrichota bacterium]